MSVIRIGKDGQEYRPTSVEEGELERQDIDAARRSEAYAAFPSHRAQVEARAAAFNAREDRIMAGVQPFASTAEMRAAVSDPRYSKDEAYRDNVMRRMMLGIPTRDPKAPWTW